MRASGQATGLHTELQIVRKAHANQDVLRAAYALEQVLPWHRQHPSL